MRFFVRSFYARTRMASAISMENLQADTLMMGSQDERRPGSYGPLVDADLPLAFLSRLRYHGIIMLSIPSRQPG